MAKKEPSPRKRWYPGKPLIPGAARTREQYRGKTYITIGNGIMTADIHEDGELNVWIDSRKIAPEHLSLDTELTHEYRRFVDEKEAELSGSWLEQREAWIKAKKWRLGEYGSDNTNSLDNFYFWGSTFEFTHFITREGDEGAIIMWEGGDGHRRGYYAPEVWMGDFSGFMSAQEEGDPSSPETFLNVNYQMEGGLLWALAELGALDHPEDLPDFIQKAFVMIAQEERRAMERATGQTYFWPEFTP